MYNVKYNYRSGSNTAVITPSSKSSTASPIRVKNEREKTPNVDKNFSSVLNERKNLNEINNKLHFTEKQSNDSKAKSFFNSEQNFNSIQNKYKDTSQERKKSPIKRVNLLQSYYAIKNQTDVKVSPVREKINTSRERNNLNLTGNKFKNISVNLDQKNQLVKPIKENDLKNSMEKFYNTNSIIENKKKSLDQFKNMSLNSKSPSRIQSKSPTRIELKSPSRIQPKSPTRELITKQNLKFESKNSLSPVKILKSEKKISLLKKYEELKTRDKSPMLDSKLHKLSMNSNNSSNSVNSKDKFTKNNEIEKEKLSLNEHKRQLEQNLNARNKPLCRPEISRDSSYDINSNKRILDNSENALNIASSGKQIKLNSTERSRETIKKSYNSFREMNTSPLIAKKNLNRTGPNSSNCNASKLSTVQNKEKETSSNTNTSLLRSFIEGRKANTINESEETSNRSSKTKIQTNSTSNTVKAIAKLKTIRKIHHVSKIGYAAECTKKYNQDIYFINKNFTNDVDSIFMSVCDGHGLYGHDVSKFLKKVLPLILSNELKQRIQIGEKDSLKVQQIIEKVFLSVNYILFNDKNMDCNFSGSTCNSVLYTPEKLICANVGDSRAVLGRYVDSIWTSVDLSRDHKPSEKDESARIKKRGGRIEPYKDENGEYYGPERIWLKEDEIPGLAMSRAFGDKVSATVGVICDPEITEWKLTADDKFLILASDGLWEFLESEECINIVKDFYLNHDIEGAAECLLKESSIRWLKEEECVDDTTIIIVFFD